MSHVFGRGYLYAYIYIFLNIKKIMCERLYKSCFLLGHWDILKKTAVTRMVKPFKMSQSFGTRWDIMGHFKYLIINFFNL